MLYFKMSYFQVQYLEASEYICPTRNLTDAAEQILLSEMSLGQFLSGNHMKQGNLSPLGIFGDAIVRTVIPPVSEAATDLLAQAMLQICNCDPVHMVPFPQRGQFEVNFGDKSFVSIPDASLVYRLLGIYGEGPTFIVIEDKKLGMDDGEYQIPGEALAVAYHNYVHLKMGFAQTIFAMRIIGTSTTFYRIDFPKSYLESIRKGVRPTEHLTLFRIGGNRAKETKKKGFNLTDHSEQRTKAFTLLCSIVNFCSTDIYPSWAQKQVPVASEARVVALADTYPL